MCPPTAKCGITTEAEKKMSTRTSHWVLQDSVKIVSDLCVFT